MNKKILIIFLVVIAIFVSYFLVTKSKEQKLSVPSHVSGFVHFADKDSENKEVALITLSIKVRADGCTTKSDIMFNLIKKDRSLFITLEGFPANETRDDRFGRCPTVDIWLNRSVASIPFNQKTVDEIFLHLKGENNHYKVIRFDNEYILEPVIISNVTIHNDSHQIAKFEMYKEKEREQKEKIENQKLCEEYGGEWLSKDIWKVGDACEFVYLRLDNIPYYYTVYEEYFDGDEPTESFYLQSEEDQKRIIESKGSVSYLGKKYQKEINIAKKYCMEMGGEFLQGVVDFKKMVNVISVREIIDHWVVRCHIK